MGIDTDASGGPYAVSSRLQTNLGDYGAVHDIDAVDARIVLEHAKVFCAAVKNHLGSPGSDTV